MNLNLERCDYDYLISRGYTDKLIRNEKLFSLHEGFANVGPMNLYMTVESIGVALLFGSGTFYGVHLCSRLEKNYRTYFYDERPWFPALYGDKSDFISLYENKKMVMVEGIFDRIIFKRLFPDLACFAKLNKSVSAKLVRFIERYANVCYAAYDADEAGETAYEKLKNKVTKATVQRVAPLYKDPNEMWKRLGDEPSREHLYSQMAHTQEAGLEISLEDITL